MSVIARKRRRPAALAAIGLAGLAALCAAPAGALALVPDPTKEPDVRPGKNVAAFHNIDFVAATGYTEGQQVTIDVIRRGQVIGTAGGLARDADGAFGLEVNHGPGGPAQDGDCWDGLGGLSPAYTPDVLPGDKIVITSAGEAGQDEFYVDDIYIDRVFLSGQDVVVEGVGRYANGLPIPVEALDSGEVRNTGPVVRATPTRIVRIAGTEDGWRATYERNPATGRAYGVFTPKETEDDLSLDTKRDQILTGGHAMGYGHIAPSPPVIQLVEGVGDEPGPALGCEASPAAVNAIRSANNPVVNVGNVGQDLVVGGVATEGATVTVAVPEGTQHDAVVDATTGTWSATIPAAEVAAVTTERFYVTATFDGTILAPQGGTRPTLLEIAKDTQAPGAPSSSHRTDITYDGPIEVTLSSADTTAAIHYTVDGSDPTAANLEATGPISVTGSQTIKAIAIDGAGNPSSVETFTYTITPPPPPPSGGGDGGGGTVPPVAPTAPAAAPVLAASVPAPLAAVTSLGAPPFATKLEIARATVLRSQRRLSVLAPITGRASGDVEATYRAAGRTERFDAKIDTGNRRVRINRTIPSSQARLGTGILTLTYGGDSDTQPQEVRLRAASGKAKLDASRPKISGGRLTASGTVSTRARGVVRLQLLYEPAGQPTRTLKYTARISDGRYRFDEKLPAGVIAQIASRRGSVHSYTLFTGYLPQRIRGEMRSYEVLGAP